jgi:hypothetical protein
MTACVWLMIVQEELSGTGDTAASVVTKVPIKMRPAKSRPASSVQSATISGGMLPQQLAIYQPVPAPPQPHQFMVQFELYLIQVLYSGWIHFHKIKYLNVGPQLLTD